MWEVGPEEAAEVVLPFWQEVLEKFWRAGFELPESAERVVFTDEVHDTCRHFAATRLDGKVVYVAPSIVHVPQETILGILAHEAGHVVDLSSPGVYWFRGDRLLSASELPSRGLKKLLRAWSDRSGDEVERVADALAGEAMGVTIGYVGPQSCLVQALGRGRRRPRGLE